MPTTREIFEAASPTAAWIFDNIQDHASGPLIALVAVEMAKRAMLAACESMPEVKEQWDQFQPMFDELVFLSQPGRKHLEFFTIGKTGDA